MTVQSDSQTGQKGFDPLVNVNPPLPCILDEQFHGFIHEIGPLGFSITFSGKTPESAEDERPQKGAYRQLCVATDKARLYRFEMRGLTATKDPRCFFVCQPTALSQQALTDLLSVLRKNQHIQICRTEDVEASDRYTGFEKVALIPNALPELDWDEISIACHFLGHAFAAPIFITGMTGGVEHGAEINRRLATAAAAFGIPMGVGSQRIAIENPEHARIFAVKDTAPGLFCIANIGAAQIMSTKAIDHCRRAIDMINADALAIHLNILQELVQVEGDRNFRGLRANIAAVCAALEIPVLVKEVGGGIDPSTARALLECGVSAIDVGGKGGTSWSRIEGLRSTSKTVQEMANAFRDWGIPTAYSLLTLRRAHPEATVTATGGMRDGLMIAKAIALGANMVGIGLPLFKAALAGEETVFQLLDSYIRQLKTAMMCCGAGTLKELPRRVALGRPLEAQFVSHFQPAAKPSGSLDL